MLRNRNSIVAIALMMALLVFTACPSGGGKSFSEMSPKEKSTYFYSFYNSQYADHMTQTGHVMQADGTWKKISTPDLSQEQRDILNTKKKLLSEMYPLLGLFDSQIMSGAPSRATEQQIMGLLNRLQ